MNNNTFYLYGGSGHGKVILEILQKKGVEVRGVFDDGINSLKSLLSIPVIGKFDQQLWDQKAKMIISIGNNEVRKMISEKIKVAYGKAIHPSSVISDSSEIKQGTVIMGGVVINAETIVGEHCIINTNSSVDHDCIIENFVHISPNVGLAGNVSIGEFTHVGIGANIIQGIKVGKNVTIGAGTVVINNIPDNAIVVGNPARIIKYKEERNG